MSTLKLKEDSLDQIEKKYCGCGRVTQLSKSICSLCEARLLLARHQEHPMESGVIKTELFGPTSKIQENGRGGLDD
jgi:hypothetical protein